MSKTARKEEKSFTERLGAGVQFAAVSGASCLWFIASEGISVIENAAQMGVPVPNVITQALEVMKGHGNNDSDE